MNIQQPIIIFSVYETNKVKTSYHNKPNHELAKNGLTGAGIPFKEVEGVYHGVKELSLIVDAVYEVTVQKLCQAHSQECYLYLHNDRYAELRKPCGTLIGGLGYFKAAPKGSTPIGDHTYDVQTDTYYYISKAKS